MSKQIQNYNDQNIARKVRVALYGVVVVLFSYLFIKDLNPSGELSVSYDLCNPSPYISEFSPHGRVLDIERKEGYCVQRMVIDPVYVDVRLPQRYDRVTMRLRYQKEDSVPLSYGVRTSLEGWQWDLRPAQGQERSKLLKYKDWDTAVAQFDIVHIPLEHRRIRFMLSSPGLSEGGKEIVIKGIRFVFEKPRLNWAMFKRWAASFYDR